MFFDRITCDPATLSGQPCVRGMRLTVRRVLEALAMYPDRSQLRAEYPEIEDEDIRQVLSYAAASLGDCVDFTEIGPMEKQALLQARGKRAGWEKPDSSDFDELKPL